MAQTIKLKRSATAGNTPTTSQLALGELGINTTDGKLFLKKSVSGTESIVDVGGLPLTGGTLTGNLNLGDNVKAQFGAGSDLQIYHDGSDSFVKDTGTGDLYLQGSSNIFFRKGNGNEVFAHFADDGACKLRFDNSTKIATTATGIDVTGSVVADGLRVDGTGFNPSINSPSFPSLFTGSYGGGLHFQDTAYAGMYVQSAGELLKFYVGKSTSETAQDNVKLQLKSTGADITGVLTADEIKVGATDRIYLDGGSNTYIQESASDDLRFFVGGQQAVRVRTFGTDILGTVTADGLTVNSGSTSSNLSIRNGSNSSFLNIYSDLNGVALLDVDSANVGAAPRFQIDVGNVQTFRITEGGDISFYEDTGTTPKFFWDASTERLGLGVTNPATAFEARGESLFGSGTDGLKLTYSAGNDTGVIDTGYSSTGVEIRTGNVERARFTSNGLNVVGSVTADGLTVQPDTGATTALLTLNNGNGNGTLSQINLGYTGDPDHGNIKYTGAMAFQTGGNQTALTLASSGNATFSGSVTAGGHIITNTSSRIENQRISMEADGTLDWGSSKQYGTLTWDTNKAIIVGQQSSSLEFRTNLTGVAMTMDTSQNVNIPNGSLMVGSTTAPSAPLHVDAAGMGDIYSGLIQNSTTDTDHYNVVRFIQGASGSATGYIGTGGSATSNPAFRNSFVVGTQNSSPLVFATSDTERARIDASGHVGIKTTPSAWGTDYAVLDLNTGGSIYGTTSGVTTSSNLYFTGSSWIAKNTGLGTLYAQHTGKHLWYSSGSVSAGSGAPLSQKMELSASGNLGIGVSSPDSYPAGNTTGSLSLPLEEIGMRLIFKAASGNGHAGISTIDQSGAGLMIGANTYVNSGGSVVYGRSDHPSSGIYFDGWSGDRMRFYTGATGNPTEKMSILANGNVGIGDSNPAEKLNVAGRIKSDDGLLSNHWQVYNTGTDGFLIQTSVAANNYGHIHGEIKLQQFNANTQQIINFSATVSSIAQTVHTKAATADIDVTIKMFVYGGVWCFHVPSPSTYTDISAYIHLGAGYQGGSRSSNVISSLSHTGVPSSGVTNSVDIVAQKRILANTSGNVGIGTGNPLYKLHVSGAGHQRLLVEKTDAGGDADLQFRSQDDSTQWILFNDTDTGNNSGAIKYVHSTNKMHFRTNDVDDRLVISDDGNVGIGTSNPGYKLTVNGDFQSLGMYSYGGTNLGANADGRTDQTILGGFGILASDGNRYGNYGNLAFRSSSNYTGSSRPYLITNGYDANKFAIIQGTDSTTIPSISGTGGGVSNGKAIFVIDSSGGTIITSASNSNAFIVKTDHSGNPSALQIGGSGAINGVSSANQSFTILNVAKDTGSGKSAYFHGHVKTAGVYNTTHTSSVGHETSINILNNDPVDGGSDFDQTPTDNSDGGGTTWSISGSGDAIYFENTSGGHGGTWMKVNVEQGYYVIKGTVRLTNTDQTNIHSSTSTANYKYTHSFRFEISGGPDTGQLKWDADAIATANGTDFTRAGFCSSPVYMAAGNKTIAYNTNGYNGVQQIYITNLELVRIG